MNREPRLVKEARERSKGENDKLPKSSHVPNVKTIGIEICQ